MKVSMKFSVLVVLLMALMFPSAAVQAKVMMMATVNPPFFTIAPIATFTVDDWLSNPTVWTVAISNTGDDRSVNELIMNIRIWSTQYDPISEGTLLVVGPGSNYFKDRLGPGETFMVTNTMVQEGKKQMRQGDWSKEFTDEVTRIGYLPEGTYFLNFRIEGRYNDGSSFDVDNDQPYEIDIKNPTPPELMNPDDAAEGVVSIPRFSWQRPQVSNLSSVNNTVIQIFYTLKLWKMFENDGTTLSEEDAIQRVPIWVVENIDSKVIGEAIDFDSGTSREELISGRKYCWQIQAFDGLGRFISPTNEGKSDVWGFTIQFTPPTLNEPQQFFPLTVTWSPAQVAGGQGFYRIRVDDSPDFSSPYLVEGISLTSFTYPDDAPPLQLGIVYYFEVQTTDDRNIPLGLPDQISFTLPPATVELRSPPDGSVLPSKAPTFEWTGTGTFYKVTVFNEASDWTFQSGAIEATRWVYDGQQLNAGITYSWNVIPVNRFGDQIGDSSETWRFSLPPENQISLISPVNMNLDTIFPVFTWDAIPVPPGTQVNYNLVVMDASDNIVHSVVVTSTEYQYPQDATMLKYAARYTWFVSAEAGGAEIGIASTRAWIITPFVTVAGETVSMDEVSNALKVVMSDFPEFQAFEGKVLTSISDETGTITPEQLMDIVSKFKILKVSAK